jgi:hypothetical protein
MDDHFHAGRAGRLRWLGVDGRRWSVECMRRIPTHPAIGLRDEWGTELHAFHSVELLLGVDVVVVEPVAVDL